MIERPIIFGADSVRAILAGRKTQTRRVCRDVPCQWSGHVAELSPGLWRFAPTAELGQFHDIACPFGAPGDRLWVRETFSIQNAVEDEEPPHCDGRPLLRRPEDDFEGYAPLWQQPHYRATDPPADLCCEEEGCRQCRENDFGPHWRPSIFMPRWASRLTLEVVSVRVERLQEITFEDSLKEGIEAAPVATAVWLGKTIGEGVLGVFREGWDSLNGKRAPWAANPWVWVVEFRAQPKSGEPK